MESAKIGTDLVAVFLVTDEDAAVKGNTLALSFVFFLLDLFSP